MNTADLNFFKTFLLEQKSSILNKTNEFRSQDLSARESISDEAEVASRDLSMNLSIHLHERDRHALYQIERALGKIHNKTYGQCEGCGEDISAKRLMARPFTDLCVSCMEEHEDTRPFLN
ncbi:MAG: hypothetical protein BroJett040_09030 [Oligoflexia bacterium]|nr:MAG: hypothetical protein BroJett040_09030 [Oligoflexia bacterium]